MSHVFISYSTQNSQYANQLAAKLRQEGFDVWIDNSKLRSSDNWWESIVRALRGCSAFIVVMTPEAKASKWVQREVTLADNWQKPTFPVLLSGDNWEIYVLTQFEKATQGNLPGPDFYEKLAEYAPRKAQPGVDIVRQTGTQPIVRNSDDDDDEIRNEIASPPPVENGPVRSTQQPSLSKTIAVNPAAADTPAISKTIAVNTPSRFNRVAVAGLVGVVVVLVALVALLTRPNPLQDQVNTLAVSTATMQQQIIDLSGQLTEQAQGQNAEPTPQGGGAGQIAFVSDRDGNEEIYVMNADGTDVRRLTDNPAADTDPRWSPDGRQVVFASNRTDGKSQIYVMDADGNNIQVLTSSEVAAGSPNWSPDGQRIAFAADTDVEQQIFVMNADGTDIVQLTSLSDTSFLPRWTPDGRRIAFIALRNEKCCTVYTMDADGKNLQEFTPDIEGTVYSLEWSPDGSQMVFDSNGMIYVMNPDDGDLRLLSSSGLREFPSLPSWSPDGQQIVFVTDADQIQIVNVDGSNPRDLTTDSHWHYAPNWRPVVVGEDLMANVAVEMAESSAITRNADWTPQFQSFDGVEMALVPVGCFDMGSNLSGSESRPVNQQCFDAPFWIDVTEVTNSQFDLFDGVAANEGTWNEPDQPRENITWFEARDFCDKRSARLPTEREWEYAARGPDNLLYPWGNNFVAEHVVGPTNSGSQTSAVGTRAAGSSWVGALDLNGNVEEWVSTKFDQGRFPYPYKGEDGREDPDTNLNNPRVVRGGSWNDVASFMTAVLREGYSPTDHFDSFGFRCARDY